ncbi:hypothetical protein LEM8419_00983 [Neolewinella maritima]|uniref:TraB/GumN family protein n=1 Tax=Neolewinella maritima TaxID=1383882 RepID=A0ABN8F259_9BACT|nr:TraB/GumN family protein [Neolewinella maritima]CAH0999683.1 hypothetical protein LEM8419_00983 [Neolewinella maritima]
MRYLLPFFVFLGLASPETTPGLSAQGTAPVVDLASYVPTTADTSLLWRVSSPTAADTARVSYLFGTIHLIPSDDYFLESAVVRAINDSDEVYFEIDPRDMQDPAKMMGLMGQIQMRGDTSLKDLLSPARYDSVATYFSATGMPMFFLEKMKPMFLSAMVGQDLSGGNPLAGDNSKMKSYELELSELAQAADKPIGGLETMDFQLALFDSIPYSVQAEMLYRAVVTDMAGESGETDSEFGEMVSMYRRRAVAEMSQMITDQSAGFGNFEELLVVRRNENWVPVIMDRLALTPSLYAVGAGHLGGERGLIALLRAEGLTVEPVYP